MAYCQKSDLQAIVKASDVNTLGQFNETYITSAILKADSLIDLKLSGVYITPLSPVDTIIKQISSQLAIYYLYQSQLNLAHYDTEGAYRNFYKDSIALLDEIRTQKVKLALAPLIDNAVEATIVIKNTTTKIYSDTELAKY